MVLLQLKMAGNGAVEAAKKGIAPGKGLAMALLQLLNKVLLHLNGAVAAAAAKDGCQWHCCSC
jgi:hypothetical protein